MLIQCFGMLKELIGTDRLNLEQYSNTDQLQQKLVQLYPAIQDQPFAIAVNRTIIFEPISLNEEDEIALLPPFSGG